MGIQFIIPYLLLATHILLITVLGGLYDTISHPYSSLYSVSCHKRITEQKQEKSYIDHTWIFMNMSSEMPSNVIVAGKESNGDPIFVGRAYHNDYILPAKVVPARKLAYIGLDGHEIMTTEVELLVGKYYKWMPTNVRSIPSSAVCVGKTNDSETLYMGRTKWQGSITPGKVQVSHNALYIPYGGIEHRIENNYEILVQSENWISVQGSQQLDEAVKAGRDVNGDIIYVARASHKGGLIPGKGIPSRGAAFIATNGKEIKIRNYDVLVGNGYYWVKDGHGKVPKNAVIGGYTNNGEVLYIGRAEFIGSITSGKIHPSHGCLYIPFNGKEIRLTVYEVLVRRTCT